MWGVLGPLLGLASRYAIDAVTLNEAQQNIASGRYQVGVVATGKQPNGECVAAFCMELQGPIERRVLAIPMLGGGKLWQWADYLEAYLRKMAKECGVKVVRISGRPAWSRILRTRGFKVVRVMNEMEVDE